MSEIPSESRRLVELLVEQRLLATDTVVVKDAAAGSEKRIVTVEPAHEALLRQWDELRDWLTEDRELLIVMDNLKRAVRDWRKNQRGAAWLAHEGARLKAAETLNARPDLSAGLEATDRAYLAACRAREQARLDDARKLAAANRRLAQIAGFGLAIVAVLAIAAGVFGFYARREGIAQLTAPTIVSVGAGLIAFIWAFLVLLLYWHDPGRLVKWLEALPNPVAVSEATSIFDRVTFGAYAVLNLIARGSLLFLGTRPRALEAWVMDRSDVANASFNSRASVRDCRIALDLPVRIDTVRHDEPWSEIRRLMSNSAPLAMLISGPGGAGKTTLACRIGRRALGTNEHRPLCGRPMLPLLIEADVPDDAAKTDGLCPYIAGLLRPALGENRPLSATLVKALLRSGHVLVIVDGLSERSIVTRQAFNPQRQGFEINRLILTSRERELPGANALVEVETIPTGALFDFLQRFLREMEENGQGTLPTEDRILDACGELKRLLGETPCTPLLATMWAKEIGAPLHEGATRPRGVASLIESYVRRILLPAANGNETLVDRLTKDAAKIAARELGERYQPGYLTRAEALEVMRTLDPADPDRRF